MERIDREAAAWVLRRDRGWTQEEQEAYDRWLALDPRHWSSFARQQQNWSRLDSLIGSQFERDSRPDPDLLAPSQRWPRRLAFGAAAAVLAAAVGLWNSHSPRWRSSDILTVTPLIEDRTLPDGSIVELNRGASVTAQFTPSERRIYLERGEASFKVAKNPARPFLVEAAGVGVRAVGTEFDVRLASAQVAVLVTEGRVQVDTRAAVPADQETPAKGVHAPASPLPVSAGERAVVSLAPDKPRTAIARVSPADVARFLAWEPRTLDFTAAPLSEIVAEFNLHNSIRIELADPALAVIRMSATFRSDNVDGFLRLLAASFGVRVDHIGGDRILLYRKR